MKFIADENVDQPIIDHLRKVGYEVLSIMELEPSISDDEVIDRANRESALLLTADKDFGELVFRQGRIHHGVILIRLAGLSPQHKAELVALTAHEHSEELPNNFTVITPGALRIRKS